MDIFTVAKRSDVMSKIRSKGNMSTEISLLRSLRKNGIKGWRRHLPVRSSDVRSVPDFVFPREKIVVFVDGCFWHSCPKHGTIPKSNRDFWLKKLKSNKKRDGKTTRILKKEGWKVFRFWEHSVKKNPDRCAKKILKFLLAQSLHSCFVA